jgi:hypothetical protein
MLFLLENNKPLNLELGRDSKRDKVLNLAVKYWLHILQVGLEMRKWNGTVFE